MSYSLNTIILEPLSKEKPKNAVLLCHGYGGDGKDISILASYWRSFLPETIFICPDAPEKCAASPTGFQWFDLLDQTSEQILSKSLSDSVMLTALANDFSYEEALVEFLKINRANKDDLVITISSSGNSPNILNALKYCKKMKIKTLSLSGLKKNKSIDNSNYSIYVPMRTYGIVECVHQIFLHLILDRSMEVEEWSRNDFQNMNINEFNI